jgi:hypothetical protein
MTTSILVVNFGPGRVQVDTVVKDAEGNDKLVDSRGMFTHQSQQFMVYEKGQEIKVRETKE